MPRPGESYEMLPEGWSLSAVIADLCARAGVPPERIRVDLIEGGIDGFSLDNRETVAIRIEALASVFMFDPVGADGLLQFVPRGGAAVGDIELDDLVDTGEDIDRRKRDDQITVPNVSNLEYFDTDGGLTPDKQTSDRSLASTSVAEVSSQTTVIMRADDAARAAVIGHKVSIEDARGEVEVVGPLSFLRYSPADVVRLDGERMRVTASEIDATSITMRLRYDRSSAYASSIAGVPAAVPSTPPNLAADPTDLVVMDIPLLYDQDDALGVYVAVAGEGPNWGGAVVEMSRDGGATYPDVDTLEIGAVLGQVAIVDMPVRSPFVPDRASTLVVELLRESMELETCTLAELMNRQNLAYVGGELVAFGEAVQISPIRWQLSYLLRGRKGSPILAHAAGEPFVLLDAGDFEFGQVERYDLFRDLQFAATSFGRTGPDDVQALGFLGRSQTERPPAYLRARKVGGDLEVTWQGVGRLGGGVNVGMGQFFAGFRITLGGGAWTTLGQSITIPYSAGTLSVCAINSITGNGPVSSVTV